ncbi:MAG: chorismate mutase [Alphaproteobacteria bacterium]|nr:chorismate mutase [Alphaproteobacteria bacterium]
MPSEPTLEDIRREIDAIDDQMLDLIARRIAASVSVRQVKSTSGSLASSPIRPAREAQILRRLFDRKPAEVSPQFLFRLWRVILTSSTLAQAPVTAHLSVEINGRADLRTLVADHFCATPVQVHPDQASVLTQLASSPGDIAILDSRAGWPSAFAQGAAGNARLIGCLPALDAIGCPVLFIAGHAEAQPTGDDVTVLIGRSQALPGEFGPPLWSLACGGWHAAGYAGFITDMNPHANDREGPQARTAIQIAGCYPSPVKVTS